MATGDITLQFTLPLSAFGGQVKTQDATAGTMSRPATAGQPTED